jgi:uncharacterized protein YhbP (UPF0306 family)
MNIEQVVRDNIDNTIHMSLATTRDNHPWVCEVHFAYDDYLNLYYRSLSSRRHSEEIALNPNVAGNIVKQHALDEYPLGVYFEGTAELLQPGAEQNKAFELLRERVHAADTALEDASKDDGHKFYKITVKNWYVFGKLDDNGGRKHLLEWNGASGHVQNK